MEYSALYRKLRPKTFDDVVGQAAVVKTLRNQIIGGRVSHAYLFCGTRGTGKTSAAKIFARAINCENPQNGSPCNVCPSCDSILRDRSGCVIEMDAASNNGVDDVRALNEAVRYAPPDGLRKVYIVDEVHMMTGGAFNALLKTLEEPPPFVVFILATTDPQKLPATILSRVQRFDFARIGRADMLAALRGYMEGEGIAIDDGALSYVVSRSDGAMRDALSTLDQCVSYYYGETITLDKLLDALGAADPRVFLDVARAVYDGDAAKVLSMIEEAHSQGRDMGRFIADFIGCCREIVLTDAGAIEGAPDAALAAKTIGAAKAVSWLEGASEILANIRYYPNPRLAAEICFVSLCKGPAPAQPAQPPAAAAQTPAAAPPAAPPLQLKKSVPEDVLRVISDWRGFAGSMPQPEKGYLMASGARSLGDARLIICCPDLPKTQELMKKKDALTEALKTRYGADFNVAIMSGARFEAQHKGAFGQGDTFDYEAAVKELTDKLGDITIEE